MELFKQNDTNESISNPQNILVVDDDVTMAITITRALKHTGLTCETAIDGFQAGTVLHKHHTQLMTLDLSLPGIDGFEMLEFVRQQPEFKGLKILVISALADKHMEKAMALGADDILKKPFSNNILIEKVNTLLCASPSDMH